MRLAAALVLLAATSCAPALAPPPPSPAPPLPPATASAAPALPAVVSRDFDPLPLGLTADGVTKLCDDHLHIAAGLADALRALRGAPPDALTFDATAGRFDDLLLEIDDATELPYLLAFVSSDAAVREAARLCEPKGVALRGSLYLDAAIATVLAAYAARAEPLAGERARLLADLLRDFRRNGLALPADKQTRLREIDGEITSIEQSFMGNVAAAVGNVQVPTGALIGLPAAYVASHETTKGRTLIEITTDSRDYDPFITYSADRKAALDLYVQFTNRGGDENLRLLDRLLRLRSEKAKLLGYASWADYVVEPRMAKSPARVRDFLDRVRARAKVPAKAEYNVLVSEHSKLGGHATDHLPPPDRYYLEARVRADHDHYDAQELSNYLEVGAVKKGVLDLTARLFGLEYHEVAAPAWDPDVTLHEVWSGGRRIGRLYLDLYARPGKYDQEAMFPVRTAKRFPDGTYQEPVAALVCSFPKPGGATPALLTHDDLVSLLHELGHVLHQLLTRSELAAYSGTGVVRDFVEVPSQLFEEWAYSREALDLFAHHVKTGAKIPDALFAALEKSRRFGRALDVQHQLFLSTLDLELHTREPGFDLMKLVEETQAANESFQFVPGTHLPSSFTYLVTYAAAYYSYPWALSLAEDALGRFKKEGMFDPKVAASFRDEVLAKGGGADEEGMIAKFLGRPPSEDALYAYIEGKDP